MWQERNLFSDEALPSRRKRTSYVHIRTFSFQNFTWKFTAGHGENVKRSYEKQSLLRGPCHNSRLHRARRPIQSTASSEYRVSTLLIYQWPITMAVALGAAAASLEIICDVIGCKCAAPAAARRRRTAVQSMPEPPSSLASSFSRRCHRVKAATDVRETDAYSAACS